MLALRRRTAVVLALVLLGVVVWVLAWPPLEVGVHETPSPAGDGIQPVDLAVRPSPEAARSPDRPVPPSGDDRPRAPDRLSYVVSSARTGRPLAGASVRLHVFDAEHPDGRTLAEGTTDPTGRVEFAPPASAFHAWFLAEGHAPQVVKGDPFADGQHRVVLVTARDLVVRVRGVSRHVSRFQLLAHVADGPRSWELPRVESDVESVTLRLPWTEFTGDAALSLVVRSPGFGWVERRWRLDDLPPSIELELEPARTVEARVIDRRSGHPVAGAALSVRFAPAETVTDADGHAWLPLDGGRNEDGTVSIHVARHGYEDARLRIDAAAEQVSIALQPAQPTVVAVIDAASRSAVAGARVTARASEIAGLRRGLTDATGRFDLAVNLDLTWFVCVEQDGYQPAFVALCAHAGQDDGAVRSERSPGPEVRWPEALEVVLHPAEAAVYAVGSATLDLRGAALTLELDKNFRVVPSGRECYSSARAWSRFPPFAQTRRWPVRDGAWVDGQVLAPGLYDASVVLRSGVVVRGEIVVDPSGGLRSIRWPVTLSRR